MGSFVRLLIVGIMLYMGMGSLFAEPVPIDHIWEKPLRGNKSVRIELQTGRSCLVITGTRTLMREVSIEKKVLSLKQMDALANIAVMYQASVKFHIPESVFAGQIEEEAGQVAREIGNRDLVESVVNILVTSLRPTLFQSTCPKTI